MAASRALLKTQWSLALCSLFRRGLLSSLSVVGLLAGGLRSGGHPWWNEKKEPGWKETLSRCSRLPTSQL